MEVGYKIALTSTLFNICSCAIKAKVNGTGSLKGKQMRVRESANGQEECTSDHTKFVPKYSNETKGGNIDPKDNENNPLNENHKAANEHTIPTTDSNEDTPPGNKSKVNEEPAFTVNKLSDAEDKDDEEQESLVDELPDKKTKADEEAEALNDKHPDKEARVDEEPVAFDDKLPDDESNVDKEPLDSNYDAGENDPEVAESSTEEGGTALEDETESEPTTGGKLAFKKN